MSTLLSKKTIQGAMRDRGVFGYFNPSLTWSPWSLTGRHKESGTGSSINVEDRGTQEHCDKAGAGHYLTWCNKGAKKHSFINNPQAKARLKELFSKAGCLWKVGCNFCAFWLYPSRMLLLTGEWVDDWRHDPLSSADNVQHLKPGRNTLDAHEWEFYRTEKWYLFTRQKGWQDQDKSLKGRA